MYLHQGVQTSTPLARHTFSLLTYSNDLAAPVTGRQYFIVKIHLTLTYSRIAGDRLASNCDVWEHEVWRHIAGRSEPIGVNGMKNRGFDVDMSCKSERTQ